MDKEAFIDRLADELEAEKPPEMTYKGWFRKVAIGTDIPVSCVKTYQEGTHECPGSRLLALFNHFGPAFEARVRGATEAPSPDISKLTDLLKAALEEVGVRDDAAVIAADFAQRTGMK